jgi:ankyrin repeat protein
VRNQLENEDFDVNTLDSYGRTSLLYAVQGGHTDIAELLLNRGSDPNIAEYCGRMPIHEAAMADRHEIMQLLLSRGVDPDIRTTRDLMSLGNRPGTKNAMHFACSRGHRNTVRLIVPYLSEDQINQAMFWEARLGKKEIVLTLFENELPTGSKNKIARNTAVLYLASSQKQPEMIAALLERGGDPNLSLASIDASVAQYKMQPRLVAMHSFASGSTNKVKECLDLLLGAGGDINITDGWGWTPLHHACKYAANANLIKCLLDAGADPHKLTNGGESPLHFLLWAKEDVVELLIQYGTDINIPRTKDFQTAPHRAQENGDSSTTPSLIKFKADCNAKDVNGRTPIHLCMKREQPSEYSISTLLLGGADPNSRDSRGRTPLMMLTEMLSYDFLRYINPLLQAGADLNAQDNEGNSMLFTLLAPNEFQVTEIQTLIELGLSVKLKNKKGENILHILARTTTMLYGILEMLLETGADPLDLTNSGNSVLHEAARYQKKPWTSSRKEPCRSLMKTGISKITRNSHGQLALHFAAGTDAMLSQARSASNTWDALSFFLEEIEVDSQDIEAEDNFGARPIHYASAATSENVIRLIRAGADPTTLTKEDVSPLHIASRMRQSVAVGLLVSTYTK